MTRNRTEASAFLNVLAPGKLVTFQTFSDRDELKRHDPESGKLTDPNARCYHGDLNRLEERLRTHNQAGAGVYVMVNEGDGKGRKGNNVVRVRAVFIDTDGASYPDRLPLEPHLVVASSPGNWHLYWLACGLALTEFSVVQEALAGCYGTDPAVKDLPRVMRVPGFYHCKGEPVPVRLLHTNGAPPYTRAEFWHAWPNIPERLEAAKRQRQARVLPSSYRAPSDMSARILKAAERHVSRVASEGTGRHRALLWAALACFNNRLSEAEAEDVACELTHMLPSRGEHLVLTAEAQDVVRWVYQNATAGEPWRTSTYEARYPKTLSSRRQKRWLKAKERHHAA